MIGRRGTPRVVAGGFDSPEGPAFDRDGNLHFVNWQTSSVNRIEPDGRVVEYYNTGGVPAGLAFDRDGSLWVADEGDHIHGLLRIDPDGSAKVVANEYQGEPLNGANDLVFDRNGVIYFSDPWGSGPDKPIGSFYRYFPDGRLELIDTGLQFPNGVALNGDESAVYLAETCKMHILRYEIAADGSIGPAEVWALSGEPPGPDGMAFDSDGNLYVAHYGGSRVDVFNPAGQRIDHIPVPGEMVTNCAFGGPNRDFLYVTEVSTASIYASQLEIQGQPLNDR
jgi:gluconolactonase